MRESEHDAEARLLLAAIAALLVDEREARIRDNPAATKTEVVLADAGLPTPLIASLVRKQPEAVRKAVFRARKRTALGTDDADA